jgi:ABC-type phosphate transport system ATPase subunit
MAIGVTGSRKSTTIEVISKIISAKSESQATGQVIQLLLRQTTIPICWDDPTFPSTVRNVLVGSFDSKGKRTKGKAKNPEIQCCFGH